MTRIEIIHGDITKLEVDAIVNAAHTSLLGGCGVDGAIHRAAGKELRIECAKLNGCTTGQAKITHGYKLQAKYVIHTVGPVWSASNYTESEKLELLKSCYYNSMKLALEHGVKIVAFPTISCGAYRCPIDIAVKTAFYSVQEFVKKHNEFEKIIFIDIREEVVNKYKELEDIELAKAGFTRAEIEEMDRRAAGITQGSSYTLEEMIEMFSDY